MGSNPISPGIDPSNFSGRTKNGIDLDISSAFKATDPALWDCYSEKSKEMIIEKEGVHIMRLKCLLLFQRENREEPTEPSYN